MRRRSEDPSSASWRRERRLPTPRCCRFERRVLGLDVHREHVAIGVVLGFEVVRVEPVVEGLAAEQCRRSPACVDGPAPERLLALPSASRSTTSSACARTSPRCRPPARRCHRRPVLAKVRRQKTRFGLPSARNVRASESGQGPGGTNRRCAGNRPSAERGVQLHDRAGSIEYEPCG